MHERTVASFFSGVGGMDIGLERAGFRIVSHAEIDPYASAVLAERWPGVPNLGSVADLGVRHVGLGVRVARPDDHGPDDHGRSDWRRADLWAGGPPCQGFSVAGQRRGLRDHRSSLAATWLDLVERHRPGALLFENVPGILSSAHGLDWHALLRALGDAGYWWAYRVLDAQWFGVPQRRRRVFLVALDAGRHPDPDGPAQVLAVGARCERDHASEREAWASAAGRAGDGPGYALRRDPGGIGQGWNVNFVVDRAPHHPGGGRAPDGLAGRMDGGAFVDVTQSLATQRVGTDDNDAQGGFIVRSAVGTADDPLLPIGLDSRRYKAIGNGVVAPVAEWIGRRLLAYLEGPLA